MSESDSRDLAQDVFLAVFQNMDQVRSIEQFDAWLFTIARHRFANWLEHRGAKKRSAEIVDIDSPGWVPPAGKREGPLDELIGRERAARLHEALAELPPQMRRCVNARVVDDLPYAQIAERIGISVNTVKVHLLKARRQLAAKLLGELE